MEWQLPQQERVYLRELARRQVQIAALPLNARRRQLWYDLNDTQPNTRPPIVIETGTFERDFLPDSLYRCATPAGRAIEGQLLRHLRNHELIDDDKVTPDTFDIGWQVEIDELGVEIPIRRVQDAEGVPTGYEFQHPIKDLRRDFQLLKPARYRVDREGTLAWKGFLEELLGDLLPVAIRTGVFGCAMLTHRVVELMGMEAFFLAMYDQPDEVRRLMAYLRDNALRVMRWAEAEGLLRANTGNQVSFGSSFNLTAQLHLPSE